MLNTPPTSLIEHLRRTVLGDGAGLGDGELLGRFIERHDEAALAVLIRRHGPMVWGVYGKGSVAYASGSFALKPGNFRPRFESRLFHRFDFQVAKILRLAGLDG
jgi:hypothetical protein